MSRPALRDRVLAWLARFLTRRFFRSVEHVGPPLPDGPVILAASHLNGFVDPVLLVADLGVLPRFLAKATLWDVAVARPFLSFARIIPVHRRADAAPDAAPGTTGANDATFAAAIEALRHGHLLAVFPEGTTHDDTTLRPLRTGVARIARQAAAEGVEGVSIVPVGVTYEDKVEVRGRALVHIGHPIRVDATTSGATDLDAEHAAVRALTDELGRALARLTPDFATPEDALGLTAAARVLLRTDAPGGRPVPLAEVTDVARRIDETGPETVERVVSTTARYQMLLDAVDLDDDAVVTTGALRATVRHAVVTAVLAVLLTPFAVAGLFANLVPTLLVLAAGLLVDAPVSKGTVRFLVATVAFPATWAAIAFWDVGLRLVVRLNGLAAFPLDPLLEAIFDDRGGVLPRLVVFASLPLMGIATIALADRVRTLVGDVLTLHTLVNRRGQLAGLRQRRAELVDLARDALDVA